MNELVVKDEKYLALVEDIKDAITESVHNSRWILVEGYWLVGKLIRENFTGNQLTKQLQGLGVDVGVSSTTLWYALQTYDKYPDITTIPEGKNISWNKLITKYLPQPKDSKVDTPLPEGVFNLIYADPPWNYGDKLIEGYGAAEHHYTTMTIDELCNIKIPVADNAILFLWVTSPLLDECWPVIKSWGFEYKTSFVWDKVKHNMGHYNSVRHEFLLVCTRGSMLPEVPTLFDSVIIEERSATHSQKPQKVYEIIETLYPNGKYLELFARGIRDRWISWGDEI
jgi:N6-adenosine-specific RNA methylase IME4